ncbi:hypothetical protein CXF83_13205 [Shewanella sp. Choline-02u-19]|jgi:hypothetical protein|uniref:hypothetical protein n=1 Tax=Shewanella TaxID=22 RepID=UPI000C33C752|nr:MULTISPECIES: hypothetical protein [Shewanella]MCL1060072.1 hypothetical protein [Shewanella gelidimarina]PKG59028.1 hypothetical protein CXF82_01505 [Shewanella sp. GutDb-MelDb]PKG73762.1 hypothetical protein CXF86_15750 [Shewanella sp. GutCb]PKH62903.1 hypothetical protein CXF84_00730 [Shewanella sp. Bg11-22]PKI27592.1 hypothetical protein CXF83_13205 [Shewanella sp. Choline-02u-19]
MKRLRFFQYLLTTLSVVGWSLAVYALILFDGARPDTAVGYLKSKGVEIQFEWDPVQTVLLADIVWWCAFVSFINLGFNYYIAKHSRLGWWVNIPLLFLCSLSAGLYIRFVV